MLLGTPFYDTDLLLEEQYTESVDRIIEKYGENRFRDFEERVFSNCLLNDEMVLSTGGGIVEREINRDLLKREKKVIYLKASPSTLAKNIANDTAVRPLLNYEKLEESIFSILKHREKWYCECADVIIDTDLLDTETVLVQIMEIAL